MKSNKSSSPAGIRWWPMALIIILDIVMLVWVWFFKETIRQEKVINTMFFQIAAALLLLIWLLFLSRLRWKVRLFSFSAVILFALIFVSLFRFREFSGDIVPIFEWRWSEKPALAENHLSAKHTMAETVHKVDVKGAFDYPQFLGPTRDSKIKGVKLARDWDINPPSLIWKQPIGEGWSSFAVVGDRAITQEQRREQEAVVCYQLLSGDVIWIHSDQTRYETVLAGVGPRATPTVDAERVYTLGATGILNCLDLDTGKRVWHTDIVKDNQAQVAMYGMSSSPLVLDSLVIVSAGGTQNRSLVSYHKLTGEQIWTAGTDRAGYSSPMIAGIAGVRQILIFNDGQVVAHRPTDGRVLWKYPWPSQTENVAQPVVLPNDRVLITSGYSVGSKLLTIDKLSDGSLSPTLIWESNRLKAKFTNVVYHEGYVYGLDDGILVCLDVSNGKRTWKRGRYGHGQLILVNNLLIIQAESGEVALVEANPDAFKELARFQAIEGKTWNNPALSGPYLLVRNSQEAACYELPVIK
ncbi:PQQ-binding-like beta-propeller repeat protein [candidate division KSB1 bacterium]|nr:PQQ-binding-like beta-propeller repeat protein [candidate division KSB1 bacterium]NIR73181.1 PQQ-binding-like beta-propeller repeat protein [candidate division KSB1 bacterium]NIS26951.1 PQQ-binding-like beta-propeller repeat protein [candidate division KSB1 bacterium]NIT73789.1 PQQ-binding-like beta-propeller repeat protein [candidate division KSB1 bacterium]NIU27695.1 PQQ-binding-like beta-propeller repeat protein [candidate division KSB1 bacterium]